MKFKGISVQISMAFAVIVIIALISTGVMYYFFSGYHRNYQAMTSQNIPAVISAAKLVDLARLMIADSTAIIVTKHQINRDDVMRDVQRNANEKNGVLKDLRNLGVNQDEINAISHTFDLLIDNLNQLNRISSELMAVHTEINGLQMRLLQLSETLNTGEIDTSDTILPVTMRLQVQIDMLLALQLTQDPGRIEFMMDRFTRLDETAEIHPLPTDVASIKKEIRYFGIGGRNMFKKHIQRIKLESEIKNNLNQNRFISTELGRRVNSLFETVSARIKRQYARFDQQTRRLMMTAFSIPFMILVGMVLISLYIRKSVIRRILELEKCMQEHIDGTPSPIPVSGHDEITSMARSVAYFIEKRKEYEVDLEKAKNAAESASLAKSTFLANMSHELRTPLNAILGFSRMLANSSFASPDEKEKLSIINRSGRHLLDMINDVLDLSKIEAERIELKQEPFELVALIKETAVMIRSRAGEKGIFVEVKTESINVPCIKADVGKLRQILINLLNNAVKFTDEGGVTVRGFTEPIPEASNRCHMVIEVEDTGLGIDSTAQEMIFEPFVQHLDVPERKGTGLGLSICKRFAEFMGGSIEVESEVGKGSLFRVSIPVEIADITEVESSDDDKPRVIGLAPEQKTWKILVADDTRENLLLLKSLLEEVGFFVLEAENGREAVAVFEKESPDFIWMDMRMPEMDGYEATKTIRALPGGETIKIAAITASAFREQRPDIIASGCDEVVYKPFREHEIFEVMGRFLDIAYVYEQEHQAAPDRLSQRELTTLLADIPDALLRELEAATLALDIKASLDIISRIAGKAPYLATGLRDFVDNFQMTELRNLLEEVNNVVARA